jgi:hypothetical protein
VKFKNFLYIYMSSRTSRNQRRGEEEENNEEDNTTIREEKRRDRSTANDVRQRTK